MSILPPKPTCMRWTCQEWEGDTPVAPLLVICRRTPRKAVMLCPKCGCEYGIITPRRVDEKTGIAEYDPL